MSVIIFVIGFILGERQDITFMRICLFWVRGKTLHLWGYVYVQWEARHYIYEDMFILGERQDITFMRICLFWVRGKTLHLWGYVYVQWEREDYCKFVEILLHVFYRFVCNGIINKENPHQSRITGYLRYIWYPRHLIGPELLIISLENPDIYLNTYLMQYHINITIRFYNWFLFYEV